MERPTRIAKTILKQKKNKVGGIILSSLKNLFGNYSNQDCVIFAEGQTHGSRDQDGKPRNKPTQIHPIDFLFNFFLFYLFLAVLGLRFCARAFSSCGKWGPLFIAVHGPLTVAASLVVEHRLQTRRLCSCGSRA